MAELMLDKQQLQDNAVNKVMLMRLGNKIAGSTGFR
jgi:hypothetical protein